MSELFFDDFLRLRMSILMVQSMTRFFWIVARSEEHNLYILLDVNTEIYPIKRKGRVLLALSPFLVLNTKDGPVSIQEKFEYIMYGRLYDITADEILRSSPEVEVCASFGGLQLILRGDPSHGVKFAVDQKLFFSLIRKLPVLLRTHLFQEQRIGRPQTECHLKGSFEG